uniref:Uncharacterized protein n=1 Tax=Rhizophora mucronata TaxID=61149 RepID=A0A2P2ILU7_RHIMU
MATKSCFQVSTVSRTRATVSQPCHPIASIYTLHLPTKGNKEFNESNIPLSFYPSLSVRSSKSGYQSSRIVCKAREALDQGSSKVLHIYPLKLLNLQLFFFPYPCCF